MSKKNIILAAVTVVILLWAYSSSRTVVNTKVGEIKQDALLMPDLEKNIDNVGTVIIRSKGKSFKVHKENGQWVMPNKYNYPIGVEKIRDLVQNSARIAIIEKKTNDPKNFADLGLDDAEKADGSAIRVVMMSSDEKTTYADYMRGINRKGVNGETQRNEIYSRLFSDNQAYLVRGDLNFDLGAHTLLSGETFAIKYQKLQSINFNYPKSSADNFTLYKPAETALDFVISEPQGKTIKAYGKANAISTSLEYMELADIVKAGEFPVKDPEVIITYKTFAGLTMVVKLYKHNNDNWLTFAASADAANKQASDDAARINNLAAPWVYKVDFKSTGGFYYKLADLLKE